MSEELESAIKSKSTMSEIRSAADHYPQLKKKYMKSMENVILFLNGRFARYLSRELH